MKTYPITGLELPASRLAYGCMNLGGRWDGSAITSDDRRNATAAIAAALAQGINVFDHADIYLHGKSEQVFADALAELRVARDQLIVQSKCGIRFIGSPEHDSPGRYDFSYEHIVASVEGSLRRLRTEYLDVLLLHRPDPLVEPEEVARAFDELHTSGKVRTFGVSNHSAAQIALLQAALDQPLVVNQLELSLLHLRLIDEGVLVNQEVGAGSSGPGLLDYCRLHGMRVQSWSPLARGLLSKPPADASVDVRATAALVARMAAEKHTTTEAIVLAWLLRHPAGIQPVVGSMNPLRIADSCRADELSLSREEWYRLYIAARGARLP